VKIKKPDSANEGNAHKDPLPVLTGIAQATHSQGKMGHQLCDQVDVCQHTDERHEAAHDVQD